MNESSNLNKRGNHTQPHEDLRLMGRWLLGRMGFKDKEIYPEYSVILKNNKRYKLDLVAIRNDKVCFVIECGNCYGDKLDMLRREYGDLVLHLSYSTLKDLPLGLFIDDKRINSSLKSIVQEFSHSQNGYLKKVEEVEELAKELRDKTCGLYNLESNIKRMIENVEDVKEKVEKEISELLGTKMNEIENILLNKLINSISFNFKGEHFLHIKLILDQMKEINQTYECKCGSQRYGGGSDDEACYRCTRLQSLIYLLDNFTQSNLFWSDVKKKGRVDTNINYIVDNWEEYIYASKRRELEWNKNEQANKETGTLH